MGRLDGKICAITGAASGIARGAAEAFVAEGATVYLIDRNEIGLNGAASELGDRAIPLICDVTSEESVESTFARIRKEQERFDVLYTCAAVQLIGEDAPVHELDADVWDRTHSDQLAWGFSLLQTRNSRNDRGWQWWFDHQLWFPNWPDDVWRRLARLFILESRRDGSHPGHGG